MPPYRQSVMRRLTAAIAALLLLPLASCGDEQARGARVFTATETPTPTEVAEDHRGAPPIQVVTDRGQIVDAHLSSYCWRSMCVDMLGPLEEDWPDVGSPDAVDFYFPLSDTHFSATLRPLDVGECHPDYVGTVTDLGDGRYRLAPAGPPGRYVVDLVGHAPPGDVPGHFIWSTAVDGPLGEPRAELSVVWKPDGTIEPAYIVLDLRDLARTPEEAAAKVTVTAGNGASMSFDMGMPEVGCPESGYVSFWRVEKRVAREAAALGPEPFRYDVELVMDGATHSASATWPDDHVDNPENNDPAPVPLVFNPPLPARE